MDAQHVICNLNASARGSERRAAFTRLGLQASGRSASGVLPFDVVAVDDVDDDDDDVDHDPSGHTHAHTLQAPPSPRAQADVARDEPPS